MAVQIVADDKVENRLSCTASAVWYHSQTHEQAKNGGSNTTTSAARHQRIAQPIDPIAIIDKLSRIVYLCSLCYFSSMHIVFSLYRIVFLAVRFVQSEWHPVLSMFYIVSLAAVQVFYGVFLL